MGLGIPKLVDLRDEWAVQSLVLFSFSLQVFLLLFAWIRRDSTSTVARVLLWLAYLLADSTAVFTLGHLSISSKLPERHRLLAFWAPFLLVHLGGQDTITAYSFEDNRLWMRHLQTLAVQVLGVAYVLYKYMPIGENSELTAAAVLIFMVGILKYGERIWALRSATFDSMWSSIDVTTTVSSEDIITASSSNAHSLLELVKTAYHRVVQAIPSKAEAERQDATADPRGLLERVKTKYRRAVRAMKLEAGRQDADAVQVAAWGDAEAVLMGAHGLFDVCKGLFIGMKGRRLENMHEVLRSFQSRGRLDKLMEMELSLMYDILYTKAAVIHTWYGCCICIVSLVATAAALLLFQLSLVRGSKPYDRRKADVTITYVLLAGALILEVVSVVSAAGSTWTRVLLHDNKWRRLNKWRWLDAVILQLRSLVFVVRHRRWSGSLGQHNLLESCARDASRKQTCVEKAARSLGLQRAADYWCGRSHACSAKLSDSAKELVLREILVMGNRGEEIGSLPGLLTLQRLQLDDHIGWSIQDMEIEDSIMAWHLASQICLYGATNRDEDDQAILEEAVRVLSNYMMFLLVVQPYMLPGPVRHSRYMQSHAELRRIMVRAPPSSPEGRLHWALVKGLHAHTISSGPPMLYDTGVRLAHVLHHRPDGMEVIFGVWVEMLCYIANNCSTESHARQLSNGGEFVTIVWLMARHANLSYGSS